MEPRRYWASSVMATCVRPLTQSASLLAAEPVAPPIVGQVGELSNLGASRNLVEALTPAIKKNGANVAIVTINAIRVVVTIDYPLALLVISGKYSLLLPRKDRVGLAIYIERRRNRRGVRLPPFFFLSFLFLHRLY
uniref:Uncharacterized protein n=1 Tax=Nymphaea colorata TaxID=210225 RepID=A0A5K1CFB6_9MAGN